MTMTTQPTRSQVTEVPMLSDEQVGHIRHIGNLSRLPRGDWRHMSGALPLQEDFSAYRYQLGYMSLAMGLAHYHQLPAAPAIFRRTLDGLIQKMLEPDVWWYWRDTSTAGGFGPFTLPQLPSRTDPVAVDNIMYSAYLQVMTLQYTMLFDDRKYEEPGSLTFRVRPFLWGGDRYGEFKYDQRSLTERIYWNLVQNGYLGVACEPLCVFQLCNQVPILGYRLHDHIYGGDMAQEATEGYLRAWADFGSGVNARGHFIKFVVQRNELLPDDVPSDADSAYGDAWLGMLMNMWRPELVRKTYRDKVEHWLDRAPGGTIAVKNLGRLPGSEEFVQAGTLSEMGWLAGWASEMGDDEVVSGLLRHADSFMNPQWENGGLYYPRCDDSYDSYGRFVNMTPTVSNAMLPYARLNVADGLRTLFEHPWTDRERSRPALTEISDQVDVRRAWYHEDSRKLQLTVSPMHGLANTTAELTLSPVWSKDWSLLIDGVTAAQGIDGAVVATEIGRQLTPRRRGDALDLTLPLNHGSRDIEMVWGRE
jgi:hypothetical protein